MGDSYPGGNATLSYQQIEQLWTANGGDPRWAPLMAAIAEAESSGHWGVLNDNPSTGDYSVGLWQINYYGNLLNSRTKAYGSPQTLWSDPNAQAKAAVSIFANGAGAGAWQGDGAWRAWHANGAPMYPTQVQLASFGAPVGGSGAGVIPPPAGQGGAANAAAPGQYSGISLPVIGQVISGQQEMVIKGWFFILAGGAVAIVGAAVVLAALGLETRVGRAAVEAVPGGVAIKAAAGRGSSTQRSRRQASERTAERRQAERVRLAQERGSQRRADAVIGARSEPGARVHRRQPQANARGAVTYHSDREKAAFAQEGF